MIKTQFTWCLQNLAARSSFFKPSGFSLSALMLMALVVASEAAPADQNYDGSPLGSLGGTTVTLNGIEYSNNDSLGMQISIVDDGDLASGGDRALAYRSSGVGTSTQVSFKSADGSEFKLNSFAISVGFGNVNPTISGYRNGSQVVSTMYDLSGIWFGTFDVSGNPSWENIDEVRITNNDLDIDIDDLDFSPAVVPNQPPSDITLSANTVNQSAGANAVVGSLSSTDENGGDTHTYTLESGEGGTDNGFFNISGTDLRASDAGALAAGSYSVRVQTDDGNGGTYQESFTISVVDDIAPTVLSVAVPSNGTRLAGENLDFTVNFSEAVTVTGTPVLNLLIGSVSREAALVSGSGTTAVLFRYTVQSGDVDADGIAIDTLSLSGATLQDAAGNDAVTTLNNVGGTSGILVDAQAPQVASIVRKTPAQQTIDTDSVVFEVAFTEDVTGVAVSSFIVTPINGSSISGTVSLVEGGPSVYDVTVQITSGTGEFRLDAAAQ